ncbi:type II toxin-antitoxin system RelE/ParE family toxin [Eggerthella lenta]|uniref:type II toxin-antitoxin system RelE/ParE family toxin n=1 Tax=Eggerthella lenta TaxID=84112 RepID=UPI00189F71DD|nr:type II toxin-antitoxin system RelE/ParE family toxin [Eggerthella lenta]
MDFQVVFYRRADGSEPIREFMDALRPKLRSKMVGDLAKLEQHNIELREPYAKHMGKGLFELRIGQTNDIVRAFYFFYEGRRIIVTNGFVKKTNKTPRLELERARRYKRDWEERRPL